MNEWKMNPLKIKRVCSELDIEFEEFEEGNLNKTWKNRDVFIDISAAADLEIVFARALKELPRRILMVIPEWRERKFFDVHSGIDAEDFYSVSHDADVFLVDQGPAGFRLWDCWMGYYSLKDLKNGWVKDLMSGTEGEVLRFHGPEEEHEPDSVPAHDGFAHSSAYCPCNQRMFENVPSVRGALHTWQ